MDIDRLRKESPELYSALIAEGVRQERGRALAHLDIALWYDSLQEATEAIRAGEPALSECYLNDRYAEVQDERDREDAEYERRFGPTLCLAKRRNSA